MTLCHPRHGLREQVEEQWLTCSDWDGNFLVIQTWKGAGGARFLAKDDWSQVVSAKDLNAEWDKVIETARNMPQDEWFGGGA